MRIGVGEKRAWIQRVFGRKKLLSLSLRDTWVHDIVAIFLLPSLHIIANIFLSSSYFFLCALLRWHLLDVCLYMYVCRKLIL